MDWTAGGVGNTIGNRPVIGRWNVGSANTHVGRCHEGKGEVGQPAGIGVSIVIGIGHNFTSRRLQTNITGLAQTPILGADQPEAILLGDGRCFIA